MSEVLGQLEAFVAEMRGIARSIAGAAASAISTADHPRRSDLVEVEQAVASALGTREETVHGGGFVAAPHLLADAPWWLEWFAWDAGSVQRLVAETDPGGARFFDYTLMPWYAGPRERPDPGRQITGPYVDYLCTDDYTLTVTEAVATADGSFAGVAGVDIRILAVERLFLAPLRDSGRLLVLVNELGRVVLSTSSRLLSGDLVTAVDVPTLFDHGDDRLTRIADSELGLLYLGPR